MREAGKQELDMRGRLLSNKPAAEAEMTKSHQLRVEGLFTVPDTNNHLSSPLHMQENHKNFYASRPPTSMRVSRRFGLFSMSCPCSLRNVQRNKLRF